jgi:hypothetical protein
MRRIMPLVVAMLLMGLAVSAVAASKRVVRVVRDSKAEARAAVQQRLKNLDVGDPCAWYCDSIIRVHRRPDGRWIGIGIRRSN